MNKDFANQKSNCTPWSGVQLLFDFPLIFPECNQRQGWLLLYMEVLRSQYVYNDLTDLSAQSQSFIIIHFKMYTRVQT